MANKILLLVEGEKKDVALMERMFEVYLPDKKKEIVPYKTNIYELYGELTKDYGEEGEFADLLMVLREREKDKAKKKIFDEYYSDVILVFDFDPHDGSYSADKLQKMIAFFDNSTENGRLYVNYPMVESFCHIKSWEETPDEYNLRQTTREVLRAKQYKTIVNNESCCTDIRKYEKKEFDRIILLNLTKVLFLLGREGEAYDCSAPILEQVLCRACQRWEQEGLVDVLSTCVLYVYEFYPKKVAV